MSRNHDNVTWKGADGLWRNGFFREEGYGDFDHSEFEWVSHGFVFKQDADRAFNDAGYPNPGGGAVIAEDDDKAIAEYDRMAWFFFDPSYAKAYKEDQIAAKKTAHVQALIEQCEKENWYSWDSVSVSVADDDEGMVTGFGMFTTHTGTFVQNGDWIMLNNEMKIWNQTTREFAVPVRSIRRKVSASRYRW